MREHETEGGRTREQAGKGETEELVSGEEERLAIRCRWWERESENALLE